jgi:hypothetical protein
LQFGGDAALFGAKKRCVALSLHPVFLVLELDLSVIVAVIAVWMVQVTFHQVIDVIPVRHGFVAAASSVLVFRIVSATIVGRRAGVRVRPSHTQHVLFNAATFGVMKVAIVQVVSVPIVVDGRVSAVRTMIVVVSVV